MAAAASSSAGSVASLTDAAKRWKLAPTDVTAWRGQILGSQTRAAPTPLAEVGGGAVNAGSSTSSNNPQSRAQFLDDLRLRQVAAEARLRALQNDEGPDDDEAAVAASEEAEQAEAESEESESDEEESDDEEEGDDKPKREIKQEEGSDDDEEEEEYENELEYYVHELLCVDAINHDPPSGKEGKCPYCVDGKKFESEFACSTCAFVRGVCTSCRKVVVLRSLEEPAKGAAVCMALLSDPALLRKTLEPEDDEETEGIRGQITFMLDAYFDKNT